MYFRLIIWTLKYSNIWCNESFYHLYYSVTSFVVLNPRFRDRNHLLCVVRHILEAVMNTDNNTDAVLYSYTTSYTYYCLALSETYIIHTRKVKSCIRGVLRSIPRSIMINFGESSSPNDPGSPFEIPPDIDWRCVDNIEDPKPWLFFLSYRKRTNV